MGSEMCIRDRFDIGGVDCLVLRDSRQGVVDLSSGDHGVSCPKVCACLLYTSDAADERSSVDLGGRRIIKKKKIYEHTLKQDLCDNKESTSEE